jgi:hypothetical protein
MGRYLKRYICHVPGLGYEWNEDPKHAMTIVQHRGKVGAKPQGSPCSKDTGKSDPMALDLLEPEGQTAYRSDTGRILYIASGRFDLQYTAKLLGEQMSSPLRLGNARLERCARYLSGYQHLCLLFKHEAQVIGSWVPVDSSWADDPDRYSTHAGCEFVGSHLIESWVATDQVRALSTAEAELYGIVDGSARGIMTQNTMKEIEVDWSVEVGSDSSAAISISSKSGVGKTRHIALRWLWVQDAVRTKQIKLKKVDGATTVSDMGTKPLEPKRHLELMKLLPLVPPTCKKFLAMLTVLAASEIAEGAGDVCPYGTPVEESLVQTGTGWTGYILIVIITVAAVRAYDYVTRLAAPRAVRVTVSVASQTQTTYTEVRGAAQPRFRVLPEYAHG